MKSGGLWNLRGLRPEREIEREGGRITARRSSASVGEWLNNVIQPDEEDPDEPRQPSDFDYEAADRGSRRAPEEDREQRRDRGPRRRRGRDRNGERDSPRNIERENPRADDEIRKAARIREEAREVARREGRRVTARTREELGDLHGRLDKLTSQLERLARNHDIPRPQASPQRPSPPVPMGPVALSSEQSARLTGAPAQPRQTVAAPRHRSPPIERPPARYRPPASQNALSIDEAVAEIAARQRALEGDTTRTVPTGEARQRGLDVDTPPPFPAGEARQRVVDNAPTVSAGGGSPPAMPADATSQHAFHGNSAPALPAGPARETTVDLSGLEQQLRQITARIEALRPSSDLENSVAAIRTDLAEIARLITAALPRRAVESLEIEVKALAERIDHSRQSGVDLSALAGLERGLVEVREALRGLTPAENLVGFHETVRALSQKVDLIVAKDDPAALQQLETAIGALRGIVSHVASNETLTKVAEDVRALAAKVDSLASSAVTGPALSALERRIETLASAVTASTEAGHAVPRELEKLLSGLIEKLEWVQLTHTDHAALAHLEDRIATLVQRFDASDARFSHLEAVERGLADLLVHIDQIRGLNGSGALKATLAPAGAIERDVAEIKQSELRTQDSLEAVQGTVEHVVGRLAIIESDIRETTARGGPAQKAPVTAPEAKPQQPPASPEPAPAAPAAVAPTATQPPTARIEPAPHRATTAPTPIDPNLPPNHPLEPGSAPGRSRAPSAADRIAASEAAFGSAKPPVIADPNDKPNFIAAARRAAQAAAAAAPYRQTDDETAEKRSILSKMPKLHARTLIVAGAAVLIAVGCLHVASRFFEDGGSGPAPVMQPEKASPSATAPEVSPPPSLPPPEQIPLPAPSAPPIVLPSPPPNDRSGAIIGAPPVRQLVMHDSAPQTTAPDAPPTVEAAPPAAALPLPPGPDFTGSLPHLAAPQTKAKAPAPGSTSFGDKLPAAIGGPALRAAAVAGDPSAAYEVAMRFAEGRGVPQSNDEAALWLERAAKLDLAPAQFRLGGFYEKGLGVKKDLAAARDLYLAAAAKGNGKAMHNLAVLYAEGIDGPADYRDAAHWFRTAANHGITDSEYNLGILYARGVGVEQNYAESYKWFALTAIQGDQDAGKKRDEVASHLDQQSLAAARLAVKTWSAEPQPDEAINVKTPAGGWDVTAGGAQTPKSKPRSVSAKAQTPDVKVN